jgi:hypothetical protein
MSSPDSPRDDLLAAFNALASHDLEAPRVESVRRRAHVILARRHRGARAVLPALAAFARLGESVLASGLGACSLLWIVGRCLQIYGLLPG